MPPKRKTSKTRRDTRRAHDALSFDVSLVQCPNCQEFHERHRVCMACGQYRGRTVFEVVQA